MVFPEPSIPSTTNSFPGYSCGVVRLFNMVRVFPYLSAGDFEPYRRIQLALERRDVPVRRPQLQLRIAVSVVGFLRRGLPMVSRNQRDHFDLLGFEAA